MNGKKSSTEDDSVDETRKAIIQIKQQLKQDQREFSELKHAYPSGSLTSAENQRPRLERAVYRENLLEFATKKKETMLLQYSLHIKQGEIERMQNTIDETERQLTQDERELEEEAIKFDKYLKDNDKSCMEAWKKAESETKARLEKTQELKRLTHQMISFKNELSKNEDQISDLKKYREFLWNVASGSTEEPNIEKIPFESTADLMNIFNTLEESNLSLIQVCQETEESAEDLKRQISAVQAKGNAEISQLELVIENITRLIKAEDEKTQQLRDRIQQYSSTGNNDKKTKLLKDLNEKVKDAYEKCIGNAEDSLSTISMLTAIENKLEKIFDLIESLPQEKVELAEKQREKDRRQRLRLEKLEAQKQMQEERARKALQRALTATSHIKKPIDKKELYKPRLIKKEVKLTDSKKEVQDEEVWNYL